MYIKCNRILIRKKLTRFQLRNVFTNVSIRQAVFYLTQEDWIRSPGMNNAGDDN